MILGRSREVFASPSLRGWEQKELGERARGKIIVFYICIVFISPPHCFGEGCSFRINPLGAARDAFAGRTIFLPPQRGSVTRFMGWSSPKCRPGLAAGFWGFPCPYPAGFPPSPPPSKPSGSASAPHPEQNRFGIVSAGWCHRCDAGGASGDECVPPPEDLEGARGVFLPAAARRLGKTLLAGEEEDDGRRKVGRGSFFLGLQRRAEAACCPHPARAAVSPARGTNRRRSALLPRPDGPVPSLVAPSLGSGDAAKRPKPEPL